MSSQAGSSRSSTDQESLVYDAFRVPEYTPNSEDLGTPPPWTRSLVPLLILVNNQCDESIIMDHWAPYSYAEMYRAKAIRARERRRIAAGASEFWDPPERACPGDWIDHGLPFVEMLRLLDECNYLIHSIDIATARLQRERAMWARTHRKK